MLATNTITLWCGNSYKLLLRICMHECHVGLYSLHTQYNSHHMHAHAWWYSEADENIPTWRSSNNVGPMHKPLAGSTVCMCDSWKQHTFYEREFTKVPHCQSVAMLFYYMQVNNVQHVLNYNHGIPNLCAQQMAKSIFSLNRSGSFNARGR